MTTSTEPVIHRFPNVPATSNTTTTPTRIAVIAATWRPTDPLRVELALIARTGATPIRWSVARDLLAAGLHHPAGDGDITALPHPWQPHLVEIVLRGKEGIGYNVALHLPAGPLRVFLDRTYTQTPAGAEDYPFDITELHRKKAS